jgi:hypothetical protein
MVLLPSGGALMHKVKAVGGVVKNAQWLMEQHEEWAMQVTDNKPERLLGMVMDNTKANRYSNRYCLN